MNQGHFLARGDDIGPRGILAREIGGNAPQVGKIWEKRDLANTKIGPLGQKVRVLGANHTNLPREYRLPQVENFCVRFVDFFF
jgi:hypothetical protein